MEVMSVFVNINFKYGLSNIFKNSGQGEVSSVATYISIGYLF
jgi:hypothetical protein